MIYTIDTSQPMPKNTRGRNPKYPFHAMKVGDSFEITDNKLYTTTAMSAYQHGRRYNKKFSIKKDSEKGSVRCWRTK